AAGSHTRPPFHLKKLQNKLHPVLGRAAVHVSAAVPVIGDLGGHADGPAVEELGETEVLHHLAGQAALLQVLPDQLEDDDSQDGIDVDAKDVAGRAFEEEFLDELVVKVEEKIPDAAL